MKQTWPLIGRSKELINFRELLDARTSGGMILAGAPGVGKTRIARECLQIAEKKGFAVAVATATRSASQLPFGAMAPLLVGRDGAESGLAPTSDRAAMLRRAAATLLRNAGGRPLLLFVDDAHLLDDGSATLVHQIAASRAAVVLLTVVSGADTPDSVMTLWKDGLATRIDVPSLSPESVEELVRAVLEGPVDGATAVRLAEASQGNALYLRELLICAEATGALTKEGELWCLTGPLAPSERLTELIEMRLHSLSRSQRKVLEVVSFAQYLTPEILAQVCDLLIAAELERDHLLVSTQDAAELTVRLAHPLYAEVVRSRTPALRTLEIARQLADSVENSGSCSDDDVLRVAVWRLTAGGAGPELLLTAARIARWRYDFPLAERLATAAAQAGAGYDAHLLIAQLAIVQGHTERANTLLTRLASSDLDDDRYAEVALLRIETTAFHLGKMREAEEIATAALARLHNETHRQDVESRLATIAFATSGPRAALDRALPQLEHATGEALIWASMTAAHGLTCIGELSSAIVASEKGEAAQAGLQHRSEWYPCFHLLHRCDALNQLGKFDVAERIATEHYRAALTDRCLEDQATFAFVLSKAVGDRGGMATAAHYAREAVAIYHRLARPQFELWARQYLATALALQGHATEAAEVLDDLDALGVPFYQVMAPDLVQARAWSRIAAGDLDGGRRLLREAAATGNRSGDYVGEASALHALARLEEAPAVAPRLSELTLVIEGELIQARSAHASALATGDATALDAVSVVFDRLGATLLAAEAAADAAVAWRHAGQPRRAGTSEIRADLLAERAGFPVTPALSRPECRAKLTPSERKIALLVASGRTNKAVAAELQLSIRTVESHLQRAYSKLNISRRSDLSEALGIWSGVS
ncbi:AAA family ATPase [Nocardia sp. NPDC004123]